MATMGTKSREVIWGGQISGAKIHARHARQEAQKAARGRPRRSVGVVGPNGRTRASLPLTAIRRPRDTPIWKLEASLKCRSCRKGRYAPPVRMIKLTERQEITPYKWVHPDEER
jgi:hypothetical protein